MELAKKEVDILKNISGNLPLEVPAPKVPNHTCTDDSKGRWFTYYRKIAGTPLTSEDQAYFSDKELLAKQLAGFLRALFLFFHICGWAP